jgi:hypothetical protein
MGNELAAMLKAAALVLARTAGRLHDAIDRKKGRQSEFSHMILLSALGFVSCVGQAIKIRTPYLPRPVSAGTACRAFYARE